MQVSLPLEKMSVEDKLRLMETIWDDLCRKAEEIPSPGWHKKVLKEREKNNSDFIDWEKAKKQIKDNL